MRALRLLLLAVAAAAVATATAATASAAASAASAPPAAAAASDTPQLRGLQVVRRSATRTPSATASATPPGYRLELLVGVAFGTPGLRGNDTTAARLLARTCLGGLLRHSVSRAAGVAMARATLVSVAAIDTDYVSDATDGAAAAANTTTATTPSAAQTVALEADAPVNLLGADALDTCSGQLLVAACAEDACHGEPLRVASLVARATVDVPSLSIAALLTDDVAATFPAGWLGAAASNATFLSVVEARLRTTFVVPDAYAVAVGAFEAEWWSALVASPAFDTTSAVYGSARAVELAALAVVAVAPAASSLPPAAADAGSTLPAAAVGFVTALGAVIALLLAAAVAQRGARYCAEGRRVYPGVASDSSTDDAATGEVWWQPRTRGARDYSATRAAGALHGVHLAQPAPPPAAAPAALRATMVPRMPGATPVLVVHVPLPPRASLSAPGAGAGGGAPRLHVSRTSAFARHGGAPPRRRAASASAVASPATPTTTPLAAVIAIDAPRTASGFSTGSRGGSAGGGGGSPATSCSDPGAALPGGVRRRAASWAHSSRSSGSPQHVVHAVAAAPVVAAPGAAAAVTRRRGGPARDDHDVRLPEVVPTASPARSSGASSASSSGPAVSDDTPAAHRL